MKTTYSEPTTLWRLRHPDGRRAHALIIPRWTDTAVLWFVNDRNLATWGFNDWKNALEWANEVRDVLIKARAWRHED